MVYENIAWRKHRLEKMLPFLDNHLRTFWYALNPSHNLNPYPYPHVLTLTVTLSSEKG